MRASQNWSPSRLRGLLARVNNFLARLDNSVGRVSDHLLSWPVRTRKPRRLALRLREFPAQAWRCRLREAGYWLALGSGPTTDVAPPDDGHFAEEDIDELRQFINPRQP